jgi:hypothetical protein
MNLEQIAGVVIILGVLAFIVAMMLSPRLYQEPDLSERAAIVDANRGRWNISQLLFGLGILMPAVGFLLLSLHLQGMQSPLLIDAAAAAFILGGLPGAIFVYQQTLNPLKYWQSAQTPALVTGYVILTLAGLLLYGIVFLQGAFPVWTGYLAVAAAVLLLLAYLISRGHADFAVASLTYFVVLVMGIVVVL